jgi:hypothetical protein
MPIFDLACKSCGARQERYLSRASSPNPPCEDAACGGETVRCISRFGIIWTGVISGTKYGDPTKEGYGRDGHWVTQLRTPDGVPRQKFITTFQEQAEHCRQEGLVNPRELSSHMEATGDKSLSGRGMPGAWT